MARAIQEPVKGCSGFYDHFLGLTYSEVSVIKKPIENALKTAQTRSEYFKDIHEGGEATEGQQTKMVDYADKVEMLENIIDGINSFLKNDLHK